MPLGFARAYLAFNWPATITDPTGAFTLAVGPGSKGKRACYFFEFFTGH
ncbi:MAG: hypothetical protein ACRDHZ_14710 [Ktedonobacteraceae bacterium]